MNCLHERVSETQRGAGSRGGGSRRKRGEAGTKGLWVEHEEIRDEKSQQILTYEEEKLDFTGFF